MMYNVKAPRFNRLFVCMSLLVCLGVISPAALVIDDFTISQSAQNGSTTTIIDPTILSGYRDLDANYYFTADINQTAANQLYCESSATTGSYVLIFYDGPGIYNYSGLGHMDMTGGGQYTGFELSITTINASGGYIGIDVSQEGKKSGQLTYSPPAEAQTLFFAFDDFTTDVLCSLPLEGDIRAAAETFDFTDVGFLRLYIYLEAGGSCTIDSFSIVPEPATLMLLVMGGLFIRKRK